MTFNELAAAVNEKPDCSVEINDAFIGSTHLFAKCQQDMVNAKIAKGIDLKKDHEAYRAKLWMAEVLTEITEGRTKALKKWTFNNY